MYENKNQYKCRTPNKPVAIMAADVKAQTTVLRKNYSDNPHCSELNRHNSNRQNVGHKSVDRDKTRLNNNKHKT